MNRGLGTMCKMFSLRHSPRRTPHFTIVSCSYPYLYSLKLLDIINSNVSASLPLGQETFNFKMYIHGASIGVLSPRLIRYF